jgi:hypothetical protein
MTRCYTFTQIDLDGRRFESLHTFPSIQGVKREIRFFSDFHETVTVAHDLIDFAHPPVGVVGELAKDFVALTETIRRFAQVVVTPVGWTHADA